MTPRNSCISQVFDQSLNKDKLSSPHSSVTVCSLPRPQRPGRCVPRCTTGLLVAASLRAHRGPPERTKRRQTQCTFTGNLLRELNCSTIILRTCLVNFLVKNGIKYLASSRVKPLSAFLLLILHSSSVSWSASTALPCQSTTTPRYFISNPKQSAFVFYKTIGTTKQTH